MRTIAFAVDDLTYKSGIVRVVINIVNELAKQSDLLITIICISKSEKELPEIDSRVNIHSIDISKNKILKYILLTPKLKKYLLNKKFDCLIVSGMEFVIFYWLACYRNSQTKLVVWEHRNFFAGPKYKLEWIGKRLACKRFAGIITITKRDFMNYKEYKRNESNLYQIYNLLKVDSYSKKSNCSNHKIISCGYLSPIKGFDLLIKVASELMIRFDDWTWEIYGEGIERDNLQKMINEKHMESKVKLMGYHKNINERYHDYSIFVLTSRLEGMGMVLIEAQKSGLPVVSFDIPCGPSDVIINGVNGYLIKPFELKEMESKLEKLMNSEELRNQFSDQSMICHKEFEKDYIVNKWKNLIDNVLGDRNG